MRKAGDKGRGDREDGEDMRDWNRRSKGRKEGVGLLSPGRDAREGGMLLPSDDKRIPITKSANYQIIGYISLT